MPDFDREVIIDDLMRFNFTKVKLIEARNVLDHIRESMLNVLCDSEEGDEAELQSTWVLHGSCAVLIVLEKLCVWDDPALRLIDKLRETLLRATAFTFDPEIRPQVYDLFADQMH